MIARVVSAEEIVANFRGWQHSGIAGETRNRKSGSNSGLRQTGASRRRPSQAKGSLVAPPVQPMFRLKNPSKGSAKQPANQVASLKRCKPQVTLPIIPRLFPKHIILRVFICAFSCALAGKLAQVISILLAARRGVV